jgi:hypothetical protein
MFDRDLIESLPEDERLAIVTALITLGDSPIIGRMKERLLAQLLNGSSDESDESVGKRMRQYRADVRKLDAFQQLGESLQKDYEQ